MVETAETAELVAMVAHITMAETEEMEVTVA